MIPMCPGLTREPSAALRATGSLNDTTPAVPAPAARRNTCPRNHDSYTTEELLGWKKEQTTEDGGFTVRDEDITDLAARLESSLGGLVQATRLLLDVLLVGGWINKFTSEVTRVDLDVFEEFGRRGAHLFQPGRLIGVEVKNQGPVGAEFRPPGIDFDLGPGLPPRGSTPSRRMALPRGSSPAGSTATPPGTGSTTSTPCAGSPTDCSPTTATARAGCGPGPCSATANGTPAAGSRAGLPIWEPGTTENQLRTRYQELE